jgi:hypothetical protein
MRKFIKYSIIGLVATLLLTGCSNRLGNMTMISTNNVDGLSAKITSKHRVIGESCMRSLMLIPWGDFQNRLQIATDNAIDNGRKAGLQGDVLVNAKIDINAWSVLVYAQNCLKVEGDLIPLSDSMNK